jgi:anti-anti-sigma factor
MPTIETDVSAKSLEMRVESAEDAIILHCEGEISAGDTRMAFRSAVLDLLHQNHKIIVDLGGIRSMDRSGLEILVSLYPTARTAGTTLKYENLTAQVSDSRPSRYAF